jgi:hypothetical protein
MPTSVDSGKPIEIDIVAFSENTDIFNDDSMIFHLSRDGRFDLTGNLSCASTDRNPQYLARLANSRTARYNKSSKMIFNLDGNQDIANNMYKNFCIKLNARLVSDYRYQPIFKLADRFCLYGRYYISYSSLLLRIEYAQNSGDSLTFVYNYNAEAYHDRTINATLSIIITETDNADEYALYVNGDFIDTFSISFNDDIDSNGQIIFQEDYGTWTHCVGGAMFFNRRLTEEDIRYLELL